ncbi:MAG TPA: beta-ketoacyl-[acyl-carrier-protein] synthase family protein [Verrucomicrobiae bacterium]|nr:beta-ketoacyl-[acyl-carrier-protein] synthase family protein [Verrucomicrobiae bacterium]
MPLLPFECEACVLFPAPRFAYAAKPHRVVVTGAGIITAFGAGWKINAQGFRSGRTAFRPVTLFDVTRQRCKIAAQVDLPDSMPPNRLTRGDWRRLQRASRLLLLAGHEAWSQCGWTTDDPVPLVLGTTSGEMAHGQDYLRQALRTPRCCKHQASRVTHYLVQQQGINLANALGLHGEIATISNACASGANAIGHAWELVRTGRTERVLTGGYDALCHLTFAGFDTLQVLAPTPCRPFDAGRDGLTLGEGAAVLALEDSVSAQKRAAEILGEIIGYGATTDTHHLTQPQPEGNAALAAMRAACASAGVTPEQIDYVNAHGTATPQNDASEAAAIQSWAGARATNLPVSSTKAGVGHLLGAAGAVEAVASLMALRGQWLPPETSLESPDPLCRFQIVRQPVDAKVNIALSNSFGFGGANASLIFRRWS